MAACFWIGQLTLFIAAIQLGRALGLSPIITTSSSKHEEFLKSLGATHVVDRNKSTTLLRDEIEKIASAPIKHVFDAISSQETQQFGHDLLVPGGQLDIVLGQKITKADDKTILYAMGIRSIPEHRELLEIMYRKLTGLLEDGTIVVCPYFLGSMMFVHGIFISRTDMRYFLVG